VGKFFREKWPGCSQLVGGGNGQWGFSSGNPQYKPSADTAPQLAPGKNIAKIGQLNMSRSFSSGRSRRVSDGS